MKRILLITLFMLCLFSYCFSQTESYESRSESYVTQSESYEPQLESYEPKLDSSFSDSLTEVEINQKGDQTINIGLAADYAMYPRKLGWGGSATLGYNRNLSSTLAVGASMDFNYFRTTGSNIYYMVPIMAKGIFQIAFGRFEIPISVSVGGALESYLDKVYFGPIAKPEIGLFYRYSADWSLGITAGATVTPQIYKDTSQNRTGTAAYAGLTLRYHF